MPYPSDEVAFLELVKTDFDRSPNAKAGDVLLEIYQRFVNGKETALRPGMLAQWKPGLCNRKRPAYGAPVMVVDVLETPICDDSFKSGAPYFRERLDILVGHLDPEDDEFLVFHCDSRRFEPYIR